MPALKHPRSRSFRNRRHQLAAWLLLGCIPSAFSPCEIAQADGVVWGQVQTPSFDEPDHSRKTPSIRPTESVNSVLGIRSGSTNEGSAMTGTSVRLLRPKAVEATPIATAPAEPETSQKTPENAGRIRRSPARSTSPAQMVTRDNASILSYSATWQPRVPAFNPRGEEVVLIGPVRDNVPDEANSQIATLGNPGTGHLHSNQMNPGGTAAPLIGPSDGMSPSANQAIMAGDRDYFPTFMQPRNNATGTPKPTPSNLTKSKPATSSTAPSPTELLLEQPETSRVVGSGLSKSKTAMQAETTLAPVSKMPVFEKSQTELPGPASDAFELEKLPTQTAPPSEVTTEKVAPLEQLESLLPPENKVIDQSTDKVADGRSDKPTSESVGSVGGSDGGSNEGQTESVKDDSDVELPNDLTMELLLEEAAEIEPIPNDSPETKLQKAVDGKSPSLSTMTIKPLDPPPPKEVLEIIAPQLESVDSDIDLRDVHEEIESIDPSKAVSLTQLDATGRVKNHSQKGAVEQLSPMAVRLKPSILQTLRSFHARTERADSRSNWGMMHQIMVYGAETRIIARNRNYSAIAWMAGNNVCRGSRLMTTSRGKIQIREGTGLQGHQAQFLAVMSMVGVPSDYPLYVGNQRFNMEDLVEVEAAACEEGKELTFTLIGLAHYLDTDTTWTGVGGERWDFSRLIAAELSQPIVGAACGGTHRLMCFAHALRKRRLEGQPINGQWKRAEDFLDEFVQYTYSLQNRDGSMSTNWFESREDNGDLKRKVQTTGHMVEFLLTHLPDEDLADARMTRAITFLNNAMRRIQIDDSAVGYRGHALRSLAMYYQRMYGEAADYPAPSMTQQRRTHRRR